MMRFREFLEESSVYYAHPISDYNKPKEKRIVKSLKGMGHTVDNPNTQKHQHGYAKKGMKHFERAASKADMVVFNRFPNQKIGMGVGKEVNASIRAGKKAYEMVKKGELRRVREVPKAYLMNEPETKKARAKFKTVNYGRKPYTGKND